MLVTIDIDDAIIKKAKELAAIFGVVLDEFLKSALEGGIESLEDMLITVP
jgi:hypothetical protein